jgi:MFS family permease
MGAADGVVALWSFAVQRSLGAPGFVVPWTIALSQLPWILTPLAETQLSRLHPRRAFRWIGAVSYLPLLLVAFAGIEPKGLPGHGEGSVALFILVLCLQSASKIFYVPHRLALLRANLPPAVRGSVYGRLQVVAVLCQIGAAQASSRLLDSDPRLLQAIYPVAGLAGFLGCVLLARVHWHRENRQGLAPQGGAWEALRRAWGEMFRILGADRPFRTYETSFMLYGLGLNLSVSLIAIYAENDLRLSTFQWAVASSLAFPLALLAGAAVAGRLSDALGILRTSALAFLALAFFYGSLVFVRSFEALVAAHLLYGLAMAGVDVGWALGPIWFAPEGKARVYAAIHFSLVGIRTTVAPPAGYWLKEHGSRQFSFALSAVLILLGCITIARLRSIRR